MNIFWRTVKLIINLYKPYDEGPAFDEEEIGGVFEITTALSKNGLPKFMCAVKETP